MKQNSKIHIGLETDFKQRLEAKAKSLSISLSDFVRMVLENSLKGELTLRQ